MQQLTKVDIRLAPDLSLDETVRTETTPLVESSVGGASQARWEIPGNQSADLVEAFTRKADGRIIPADPHDIATQNGVVGQAMSFVDLKLQQIPFRDVAVGDTTVLTIRFKESQHYIPGQYSQVLPILPGGAKKSLDVTLRAPATLMLYHDEKDLAYEEAQEGGDVVRHWSGSPPYLGVEETDVANLVRVVPSLGFSTFPNYEAIARGYDDGAGPMEAVTPEVQRLADEITQDKADARSQAEAIFDWVSRNIRYVAVYFGRGRYVPNDTQTILSRRFGDCKDQATLLVALLAAKGIASEQTLINLNPTYELAKTATLRAFNHVIVYIPALELYVDPTVAFGAFSRLPTADLGKPVVRVSDHGAVVARTPTPSVQDNVAELNTRIVMSADGRRQGQTTVEARASSSICCAGLPRRPSKRERISRCRDLPSSADLSASSVSMRRHGRQPTIPTHHDHMGNAATVRPGPGRLANSGGVQSHRGVSRSVFRNAGSSQADLPVGLPRGPGGQQRGRHASR
jgi:transglutaminase-like putative cysteine protease